MSRFIDSKIKLITPNVYNKKSHQIDFYVLAMQNDQLDTLEWMQKSLLAFLFVSKSILCEQLIKNLFLKKATDCFFSI